MALTRKQLLDLWLDVRDYDIDEANNQTAYEQIHWECYSSNYYDEEDDDYDEDDEEFEWDEDDDDLKEYLQRYY